MISLTTNRIRLEPLTKAHAPELFPLLSNQEIYRFIATVPPASVNDLAERYQRLESRHSPDRTQQWLNWAIRRLNDGQCVGFVQATIHASSTADFAFVLGLPFWGLGLAREAAELALQSLFTEFGVASVFATTDRQNLRSAKLLTRLGFAKVQPASYPHGNVLASDDVYQLNRKI